MPHGTPHRRKGPGRFERESLSYRASSSTRLEAKMIHELDFSALTETIVSSPPDFPSICCIYCVFAEDCWYTRVPIYIGKTDCLERRMGEHFRDQDEVDDWENEAKLVD